MRWWLLLGLCACDAVFGIRALPPPDAGPGPDAPPPTGSWAQLAVGERHACAIDVKHRLFCWGAGDLDETGPGGASLVPVEVPAPAPWTQVSAGGMHTCGLAGGSVYCWGANDYAASTATQPTSSVSTPTRIALPATANQTIDQVSAGPWHACAIAGGQLWCWGAAWQSNMIGDTPNQPAPAKSDWVTVSAGAEHTCAIDGAGQVYCWGYNDQGQSDPNGTIVFGAQTPVPTQVQLPAPGTAFAVSAGDAATCAIVGTKPQGSVVCWGWNAILQASGTAYTAPVLVLPGADWTSVSVGTRGVCAVHGGQAQCWGSAVHGGLGDGQWAETALPTGATHMIPADQIALTTSLEYGETGCALANGNVSCWGDNAGGQLGTPGSLHTTPVVVTGTWSALAAGGRHTCAIDTAGKLSCWGANDIGQVTGTPGADQPSPVQVATSVGKVIAGTGFSCALENDKVACWGTNTGDQLGSTDLAAHQATAIASNASTLIGSERAACAQTSDRGQLCWGTIFGSGTFAPPQRLGGNVPVLADVGFGRQTTCGIDASTGKGVCWGYGYWGDLGDGVNHMDTMSYAPSQVMDADTYHAIAMTSDHACALADDATSGLNTVRCWGTNYSYDTANSSSPYVLTPSTLEDASSMPVTGCSSIAVSDTFSCAACSSGVQCWGLAQMGRLGRADNALNSEPAAPVHTPTNGPWQHVAVGPDHGCALAANGTLACWGLGARGEIGDGSHGSPVPVLLPGPP